MAEKSLNTSSDPMILVTGGTGFVGSYLLRYLIQKGYSNIRAIYRPGCSMAAVADLPKDRIEWLPCDILDLVGLEMALEGVEKIYHAAAMVSFSARDRSEMLQTNVEGTSNVVNMALATGVRKMLQLSSVAALGRSKPGELINEDKTWERSPYNTNYGLSKFLSEQEAWRGYAEGLEVVVLNPSIILGAFDWDNGAARFFKMIHQGLRFYPQGGTGLVDVRDVVCLMEELMERPINGERFIANAETWTYQKLFTEIASLLDRPKPNIAFKPLLQTFAWRAAALQARLSGKPALITKETVKQSAHTFYYEHEKSRKELDFNYRPIMETLQETAAKFLQPQDHSDVIQFPFLPNLT